MHILDSICRDCKYFEHECDFGGDGACWEYCTHPKRRTRERLMDADEAILKCGDFEED